MSLIPLVVCDDSNMARKQVLRALPTDWPVSVTEASNGRQAMDAIRQGLGHVVLLDLTMPEMDGIECVEHVIKIKPDVLILVVSALADKATAVEAIEKGANGFLCKPFTDDQLNEALAELIGE